MERDFLPVGRGKGEGLGVEAGGGVRKGGWLSE